MGKKNYLNSLFGLLLLTLLFCSAMYFLPEKIGPFELKKVDLLADIRAEKPAPGLDSLARMLAKADSLPADSLAAAHPADTLHLPATDTLAAHLRDSLYRTLQQTWNQNDSSEVRIEDFSPGHTALKRFFAALKQGRHLGRPVRIAFLGDSFIEGDILVADFRSAMQQHFGGHGVGFVPMTSQVAQFRPTVEHQFSGWNVRTLISHKKLRYALPCKLFEASGATATARFKTVDRYPLLQPVSRIGLIYEDNRQTEMRLICNGTDTLRQVLPPTDRIVQYTADGSFTRADFTFTDAAGFRALGVVLEDETGIVVDNFSLRGNSGMPLGELDPARCEEWNRIRPYDLIVLQYGLNVAADGVLEYGWYRQQMAAVVEHLRTCFPDTDFLLLGVSDRSRQENGRFETMPAVLALLHAQRRLAQQTRIAFWNTFLAMGGQNGMVRYVRNNWAGKDYTHLGFRGGRELASALTAAFLLEKQFYDEVDKTIR